MVMLGIRVDVGLRRKEFRYKFGVGDGSESGS